MLDIQEDVGAALLVTLDDEDHPKEILLEAPQTIFYLEVMQHHLMELASVIVDHPVGEVEVTQALMDP